MATAFHASTPPPPSSIRTPETPRFGYDDNYQPYTPRKSARVMQRSRDAKTPPPPTRYTQSTNKASATYLTSTPASPQTASKKRTPRNSLESGGRRVSGALTFDSMASAASSLGLPTPTTTRKTSQPSSALRNNGMLPTPAKTPNERPKHFAPAVRSVARNLFPVRPGTDEEVMPSPKKKGRKYTGFTLDSFEADEDSAPISIFTDSHDRVPEVDLSPDNPFYVESNMALPEPTKRTSKRRKVAVPGEGEHTVEELEQREDGLVYVFRGKKIFRKFGDDEEVAQGNESDTEHEVEGDQMLTTNLRRPLTRSSLKPRLLFPTPEQSRAKEMQMQSHNTEDEEADTDIEDLNGGASTPFDQVTESVATPKAPRFGPVTPPTTTRATRSKKVDLSSSPAEPPSEDESASTSSMLRNHKTSGSSGGSPFAQWQRVKRDNPVPGKGKKREGETLSRGGEKRTRGRA